MGHIKVIEVSLSDGYTNRFDLANLDVEYLDLGLHKSITSLSIRIIDSDNLGGIRELEVFNDDLSVK